MWNLTWQQTLYAVVFLTYCSALTDDKRMLVNGKHFFSSSGMSWTHCSGDRWSFTHYQYLPNVCDINFLCFLPYIELLLNLYQSTPICSLFAIILTSFLLYCCELCPTSLSHVKWIFGDLYLQQLQKISYRIAGGTDIVGWCHFAPLCRYSSIPTKFISPSYPPSPCTPERGGSLSPFFPLTFPLLTCQMI